jgi:hypothetical protein
MQHKCEHLKKRLKVVKYLKFKKRPKFFLSNVRLRRKFLGPSLPNARIGERLTLGMPATYRICIQGFVEERWIERLGNIIINKRGREGEAPTTILVGRMRD